MVSVCGLLMGLNSFSGISFLYCILAKADRLQKEKRNVSLLVIVREESVSLFMLALVNLWVISNFHKRNPENHLS